METRTCKKCGAVKNIEAFPFYDRKQGRRRHECKTCNTKRVEAHHEANKAERLRRARERYKADPIKYWSPERKARAKALDRDRAKRIRDEVYDKHGSECAACGERERMFLTIDHKNNDGWSKRKEGSYREAGIGLYVDILRHGLRDDLEILCYNCNFGKARNGGKLVKDRRWLEGRCNDQSESS